MSTSDSSKPEQEIGQSPPSRPLAESPWLWFGIFALAGVLALVVIGGKYRQRQARLERQDQARARSVQLSRTGDAGHEPLSTPDHLKVSLVPIAVTISAILLVCWGVIWWRYVRPRGASETEELQTPEDVSPAPSSPQRGFD